jgi:hypothetical protein
MMSAANQQRSVYEFCGRQIALRTIDSLLDKGRWRAIELVWRGVE